MVSYFPLMGLLWDKLKFSLDVNRALGHLRYVFILTTFGTSNNFMCFLSFFWGGQYQKRHSGSQSCLQETELNLVRATKSELKSGQRASCTILVKFSILYSLPSHSVFYRAIIFGSALKLLQISKSHFCHFLCCWLV